MAEEKKSLAEKRREGDARAGLNSVALIGGSTGLAHTAINYEKGKADNNVRKFFGMSSQSKPKIALEAVKKGGSIGAKAGLGGAALILGYKKYSESQRDKKKKDYAKKRYLSKKSNYIEKPGDDKRIQKNKDKVARGTVSTAATIGTLSGLANMADDRINDVRLHKSKGALDAMGRDLKARGMGELWEGLNSRMPPIPEKLPSITKSMGVGARKGLKHAMIAAPLMFAAGEYARRSREKYTQQRRVDKANS